MPTFLSAIAAFGAAFILLPLSLTACSSSNDAKPPAVAKTCTKTACDEKMSHDDSACSRCIDACVSASYDCDSSSACELSCSNNDSAPTCSDSERAQCLQQSFTVRVDDEPSKEIEAACNRMFDHLDSCKLEIPGKTRSICAVWAKAEKPEHADLYDCIVNKPCSDDLSACQLPPTTLGDDTCAALHTKCNGAEAVFCSDKQIQLLDFDGPWWRDDVIALNRSCLDYATCNDAVECHLAFRDAVGF